MPHYNDLCQLPPFDIMEPARGWSVVPVIGVDMASGPDITMVKTGFGRIFFADSETIGARWKGTNQCQM